MISEKFQDRFEKGRTALTREPQLIELINGTIHQMTQQRGVLLIHTHRMYRQRGRKQSTTHIEEGSIGELISGIKTQIGRELDQKPEVKIRDPLFHTVQPDDRIRDKIEQRTIRLRFPNQPIQHFSHEERNRTLADIEWERRQRHQISNLADAVHLGMRRHSGLQLHQEHRLQQRRLISPSSRAVNPLYHIIHPTIQIGQKISDQRTLPGFDRMQYDSSCFIVLHDYRFRRNAANFSTARPR